MIVGVKGCMKVEKHWLSRLRLFLLLFLLSVVSMVVVIVFGTIIDSLEWKT